MAGTSGRLDGGPYWLIEVAVAIQYYLAGHFVHLGLTQVQVHAPGQVITGLL